MSETILVIPCHDEAERLRPAIFRAFAERHAGLRFVFVNDGSRDTTSELLSKLAERDPRRYTLLDLPANRGRGEAVRVGMQAAFHARPTYVGYWSADLSTPLEELPRFVAALKVHATRQIVMGARVQMIGRSIERSVRDHRRSRIFATAASWALRMPVYDTQCGAKLFRNTPDVRAIFDAPFESTWSFEVEMLARFLRDAEDGAHALFEIPLLRWHEVPGTTLRTRDFLRSLWELRRIRRSFEAPRLPAASEDTRSAA